MAEYGISTKEIEEGKTMGGIAYFGIVGFLIAFLTSKENKYVVYHAQQSLLMSLIGIAAGILNVIPILGQIVFILACIGLFILFIIGLMNGFKGLVKPLPLIGEYAFKLNLLKPEEATSASHQAPDSPDVE